VPGVRIAIDGRQLTKTSSGFRTYTFNLIKGLAQVDPDNEYLIYLDEPLTNPPWSDQDNFHTVILPKAIAGFFWKQVELPLDAVLRGRKVDIFHFLFNSPSITCPGRLVYSIHDLSFKRIPDMIPRSHYLSLSLQMPLGARRAKRIITEPNSAKKDNRRSFGIEPGKIEVIPGGVNESFLPMQSREKLEYVRQKYELPNRFILYVGSFLPHKNLPALLRAYKRLSSSLREEFKLVFAGNKDWNFPNIYTLVSELSLQDQVIFLGHVPKEDLPTIYSLAYLFVFPSLYEGFGLPALEAMACGVPVVASNSSSIPEVVGEAGILVDPREEDELSQALEQVLTNPELHSQLVEKGLARASLFTWKESARRTLAVYEKVKRS